METCLDEERCAAWTFVSPGLQGPEARCWLKSRAPASKDTAGMVSGVVSRSGATAAAAAAPEPAGPRSTIERGMNRPGRDYRSFSLPNARPETCMETCLEEDRCLAWTYVPPGRQGPKAKCWLKSDVSKPTRANGMVSGMIEDR
jgi:hypothetical protein